MACTLLRVHAQHGILVLGALVIATTSSFGSSACEWADSTVHALDVGAVAAGIAASPAAQAGEADRAHRRLDLDLQLRRGRGALELLGLAITDLELKLQRGQ